MVQVRDRRGWLVWITLFFGLVLGIMPMPEFMEVGRPLWCALLLAHWSIVAPHHIGMTRSWLLGLAADVLQGSLLGMHALELSLITFVLLSLQQRMRMYPTWQQSFMLLLLLGAVQLLQLWLSSLAGHHPPVHLFMLPPLVSALLWPWVTAFLGWLDRHRPHH